MAIIDRKRGEHGKVRRYMVYTELDGRQKWVATPHGTTMAQARTLLAAAQTNVANGKVGITPKPTAEAMRAKRVTLRALIDRYCAEYTNPKVKDIEAYRYSARSTLTRHVKSHRISALPAIEVTTQQLRDLRDDLLAKPDDGDEGARAHRPAPETVKRALGLLSRLYNWANDKGFIDSRNPVSKVEKPVKHSSEGFDYLSADEVAQLLVWAERHQPGEYPLYATAVYTGMRLGELCGLRWTDVDFEMNRIFVRRSYRTSTKSGKARALPLNPHLAPILQAWKERCRQTEEGLVFPAPLAADRGKLTREQVLELRTRFAAGETPAMLARSYRVSWTAAKKIIAGRTWKAKQPGNDIRNKDGELGFHEALAGSGCHRVRFHDLRHTYASHFMMSGGNILALQKLLGHHDVKVTQKYAHLAPDHLAAEASRVSFPTTRANGKVVALADHV